MDSSHARPTREWTPIDLIANRYHAALMQLSPIAATYAGIEGMDHLIDDFSPGGFQAKADLAGNTLAALRRAPSPTDSVDAITLAGLTDHLELELEQHRQFVSMMDVNTLESPLQEARGVLQLMPTETEPDLELLATRVRALPMAVRQHVESLREAASHGRVAPVRQILACTARLHQETHDSGYFSGLSQSHPRLRSATDDVVRAYADAATFLKSELLPVAPVEDACGPEIYALHSRYFLGCSIDVEQTYSWAVDELSRVNAEVEAMVASLGYGRSLSVARAVDALDHDPARSTDDPEAFRSWIQQEAEAALIDLQSHFSIPAPLRTIEARIAGTGSGVIYYTPPTDDFKRCGKIWWSLPESAKRFSKWRSLTTVFHEGAPGHHLQMGTAKLQAGALNAWRRSAYNAGFQEGWALYAERLMDELGYFEDPGARMGMLVAQLLRTARVVIDIGVHCRLPMPGRPRGRAWTVERAADFLNTNSGGMDAETQHHELLRYLAWPGQASSYKVGEKQWMDLRQRRLGGRSEAHELKSFHRSALEIGSVGLDILSRALDDDETNSY